MILELITGVIIALIFFYFVIQWNSKRQLNKLRRNYNEQDDKSRKGEFGEILRSGKPRIEDGTYANEVRRSSEQPKVIQPRVVDKHPISPSGQPTVKSGDNKDKGRVKPTNRFPKLKRI